MAGHGLHLLDLDDYLAPAQECVLPVKSSSSKGIVLEVEDGVTYEIKDGKKAKLESPEITLADCLACSGCITSAESILVSQQSKEEFMRAVKSEGKHLVVTISPHARASFAARYGITSTEVHLKLTSFFEKLGAVRVIDSSLFYDIWTHEHCVEFVERFKAGRGRLSTTLDKERSPHILPVLESTCPGWICYAEKTHSEVLPHISAVKSPQQIIGSFVKERLASQWSVAADEIYHVSIMPCHDKKLEATRPDFHSDTSVRDVDCVLTASEIDQLIVDRGLTFESLPTYDGHVISHPHVPFSGTLFDQLPKFEASEDSVFVSSWGGCLETVFSHAVATFSQDIPDQGSMFVEKVQGRNADWHELVLYQSEGNPLLRFVMCHGFRNIQNLVRKMKRGNSLFDYVEVMACPGSCLNGGGLIPPHEPNSARELLSRTRDAFVLGTPSIPSSNKDGLLKKQEKSEVERLGVDQFAAHVLKNETSSLYRDWICGNAGSEKSKQTLHTQYHAVPKTDEINAAFIKW